MLNGWPLDRAVHLITGTAFLALGAQAYLFHSRQNFRAGAMYIPVVGAPALGILEFANTLYPRTWLLTMSTPLLWFGVGAGLYGGYRHFVGVGQRVGGYESQNFLVGPPVFIPLFVSVLSALGLAARYLGGR